MNIVWSTNPYQQMILEHAYQLQTALLEGGMAGLLEQSKKTFVDLATEVGKNRPDIWSHAMVISTYEMIQHIFKVELIDAVTTRGIKEFANITRDAHTSLLNVTNCVIP